MKTNLDDFLKRILICQLLFVLSTSVLFAQRLKEPLPVDEEEEELIDLEEADAEELGAEEGGEKGKKGKKKFRSNATLREERKGRFYVAGFGGMSFDQDSNDPTLDISGNSTTVGLANSQQTLALDGNAGALGGFKIGYETSGYAPEDLDFLVIKPAIEFEFMYMSPKLEGPNISDGGNFESEFEMITLTLNPHVKFQFFDRFTPYLGGGFGGAFVTVDDPKATLTPVGGGNIFRDAKDDDVVLLLQAIAGFEVDLIWNFSIFTEYKFLYMRDLELKYSTTSFNREVGVEFTDLTQHALTGGIRYKF